MNETLTALIKNLSSKFAVAPNWIKIIVSASLAILTAAAFLLMTSCGTTTRVVTRTTDSSSVSISITAPTSNNTDVDVNPDIDFTITRYKKTSL